MYPTGNPQPKSLESLNRDIEFLTKTVQDASHKPYLKPQLVMSLTSLGYPKKFAEEGVDAYFKVSLN